MTTGVLVPLAGYHMQRENPLPCTIHSSELPRLEQALTASRAVSQRS